MKRRLLRIGAMFAAVLPAVGCGRSADFGPPAITYGQTECYQCKMIVSEEPFAAAAVIVASDGVQKRAFDDIGCLLDFLREAPTADRAISYVHDHPSHKWLDASRAVFIRSESLRTPMASHLAAAESSAGAEELLRRYAGTTATFEQLRTAAGPGLAADASMKERSVP